MPWVKRKNLAYNTRLVEQLIRERDEARAQVNALKGKLFIWRAHYRFDPTMPVAPRKRRRGES